MNTYRDRNRQNGAVLPVALFILLMVTLLAISTMETGTTSLRIAQNQQAQLETELAVGRGAEQFMDAPANFMDINTSAVNPADILVDQNGDGVNDFTVSIEEIQCLATAAATGYSVSATLVPEITVWTFRACAIDNLTGARSVQYFGARMQLLAGNCDPTGATVTPVTNCVNL